MQHPNSHARIGLVQSLFCAKKQRWLWRSAGCSFEPKCVWTWSTIVFLFLCCSHMCTSSRETSRSAAPQCLFKHLTFHCAPLSLVHFLLQRQMRTPSCMSKLNLVALESRTVQTSFSWKHAHWNDPLMQWIGSSNRCKCVFCWGRLRSSAGRHRHVLNIKWQRKQKPFILFLVRQSLLVPVVPRNPNCPGTPAAQEPQLPSGGNHCHSLVQLKKFKIIAHFYNVLAFVNFLTVQGMLIATVIVTGIIKLTEQHWTDTWQLQDAIKFSCLWLSTKFGVIRNHDKQEIEVVIGSFSIVKQSCHLDLSLLLQLDETFLHWLWHFLENCDSLLVKSEFYCQLNAQCIKWSHAAPSG